MLAKGFELLAQGTRAMVDGVANWAEEFGEELASIPDAMQRGWTAPEREAVETQTTTAEAVADDVKTEETSNTILSFEDEQNEENKEESKPRFNVTPPQQ